MKQVLTVLLLCLSFGAVHPFGKNKVVYETYEWKELETAHFRITLPGDHAFMTNRVAVMAEEIYRHHTNSFQYVPNQKIRIVLYKNQIDFQQNNIIDWIGPGTGGFTEFIKGRVVVPISAFYRDFEHVLSHEINHAFQGLLWGDGHFSFYALRDLEIPLWLIEGAAEFNSIGVDRECETVVADGLLNGRLPSLLKLSYLEMLENNEYFYVYKEGQMFYGYISEKYGEDVFARLNRNIGKYRELDSVLSNTFGKNLDELNDEFFDHIRRKYLPAITSLASPDIRAKKILKNDSGFNINPVSLSSNRVAFISDRRYYPSILIYERSSDRLETVVRGGFDEEFLEFQYGKRNHLSVSTNGVLCFVSRSGGEDAIHLHDLNRRTTVRLDLPFRVIYSPDISPDGGKVVFAAVENQQAGIYLYDVKTKKTVTVIRDRYFNSQPRFAGTNGFVFVSNRKHGLKSGDLDICYYDPDSGKFAFILDTGASDEFPAVSDDGNRIAFVRQDVHPALMIYDRKLNVLYEEIVPTGGITTPSFGRDGSVCLAVYQKNSYNIYEYFPEYKTRTTNFSVARNWADPGEKTADPFVTNDLKPYRWELSIDNLLGGFMINSYYGVGVLGMLRMSDMLGDDRFQLLMDSSIGIYGNPLDYLNVDLSYMNVRYRHNFGARIFHYSNYFYEFATFQDFFNLEKSYHSTYGGYLLYSYPFTTFDRIEAELGYRGFSYATNVQFDGTNFTYGLSNSSRPEISVSYVHDSTLWDVTGPVDGFRYELILTKSFPLFSDSMNYEKAVFDFRSYFMLFPGYSIALRGVAGIALDRDKNSAAFSLGGFNSVRGYDLWSFSGDTMYLVNLELRVPFISEWSLGFPLPIRLPTVWGALFWDFGSVWNLGGPYQFCRVDNGVFRFVDLKSGLGFGFRLVLIPGIKIMVDLATPFDGTGIPNITLWRSFWFIGIDF